MKRQPSRSRTSARPPPRWDAAKLSERPAPMTMGKFSIGNLRKAARTLVSICVYIFHIVKFQIIKWLFGEVWTLYSCTLVLHRSMPFLYCIFLQDRSKSHVPSSGNLKKDLRHLVQRLSSRDIVNSLKVWFKRAENWTTRAWVVEHAFRYIMAVLCVCARVRCIDTDRCLHIRIYLHMQTLEGIEERLRVVLRHTPTDTDLLIFQFDRGRNESGLLSFDRN